MECAGVVAKKGYVGRENGLKESQARTSTEINGMAIPGGGSSTSLTKA